MSSLIVVSNDDGIEAPGLAILANSISNVGDFIVTAPEEEHSSMGRSYPNYTELGRITDWNTTLFGSNCKRAVAICGSPAQVAAYTILSLARPLPAVALLGINESENLGMTLTCSGTIGAALEYAGYGIPAIAISMQSTTYRDQKESLALAGIAAKAVCLAVLNYGLPYGVKICNINIPQSITKKNRLQLVRVSNESYFQFRNPGPIIKNKLGQLSVEVKIDKERMEKDSDVAALLEGKIGISMLTDSLDALGPRPRGKYREFTHWIKNANNILSTLS